MRWLILALSLGTTLATLYHGIRLFIFIVQAGAGKLPSTELFWSALMLCVASFIGFIGGIIAFNYKKMGAVFLLGAAVLTFFGYPAGRVFAYAFAGIGALSLLLIYISESAEHRPFQYQKQKPAREEEVTEDDEEEETEEIDEDDGVEYGGLKQTSLKYKIPPRRTYSGLPQRGESTVSPRRPSPKNLKVCMNCGVDMPREYNYCYACGTKFDLWSQHSDVQPEPENKPEVRAEEPAREEPKSAVEVVPVIRKISVPDNIEDEDYENDEDTPTDDDVPFKPSSFRPKKRPEADASYQSFGRYAQSRKKRKVSPLQRALLVLLGVGVAGALGWFMYMGIKRVGNGDTPEPVIEVSQPRVTPQTPEVISPDEVVAVPEPTEPVSSLPPMELNPPSKALVIAPGGVNLRADHTTTSRSIVRLPNNGTYDLLDDWQSDNPSSLPAADKALTGVWYKVKAGNNTGWVYGRYANPVDGRAASLPKGYTDALLGSFGTTREEIEEKLGKPTRVQTRGDTISLEYPNVRISLRAGKVNSIQLTDRGLALENELSVGLTLDETMKLIGAPNRYRDGVQLYLETPTRGVVIRRDADGRIRNINVGNA